jgi:benzoate membrane transport protein
VLVGFTSSVAIVFQAAQAFARHPELISLLDVGAGPGHGPVHCAALAVAAQACDGGVEHPGAAVLATAGAARPVGDFSMAEAVGAFMVCAVLITLGRMPQAGLSG